MRYIYVLAKILVHCMLHNNIEINLTYATETYFYQMKYILLFIVD